MNEKTLESKCRKYAESKGGKLYKWVSPSNNGVPDRILIVPFRPAAFIEFKTLTGTLSALQQAQIETLTGLGQKVFVVRDFKTFEKIVNGI